mmetsp:Transcript_3499/g.9474  ORF Transcript_3499/g.9474 Transcript_3499/m.9474 type:complete len:271 (+) Transcript_3499:148-960(+)
MGVKRQRQEPGAPARKMRRIEPRDETSRLAILETSILYQELGRGSFGMVELRSDPRREFFFVSKSAENLSTRTSQCQLKTLRNELKVYQAINNPVVWGTEAMRNVVNFYGWDVHEEKLSLMLEYCDGGTLATYAVRDEREAWGLLYDLANGAGEMHSRGFAHLDIKPENVVVGRGRFRLCDLGSTRKIDGREAGPVEGDSRYMAPEAMQLAYTVSPMADVYSIASTLLKVVPAKHLSRDLLSVLHEMKDAVPSQRPTIDIVKESCSRFLS